jgi:exopolyphosphatase / guanosine-5'-triphosphate,3'-diphosphate pyrophosphatase
MHTISAFQASDDCPGCGELQGMCNICNERGCQFSHFIVEYIKDRTGVSIDVIDGQQEAELVYSNRIVEMINNEKSYLYVDVGGGSTEITLFSNKKAITSGSFNIGTIVS